MIGSLLVLSTCLAQTAPLSPDSNTKARAQALLAEGATLYDQGNPGAALEKFDAAFAIYPSPKLDFNRAQALRDLNRSVEAMEALERFVAGAPDASPTLIAEAKRGITELQSKLGRLEIECPTPGVAISVDGRTIGATPVVGASWVSPGRHQVTGQKNGYVPAIENFDAIAGRTLIVAVRMRALMTTRPHQQVDAVGVVARPDATITDRKTATTWSAWSKKWWFWTSVGTAIALTGAVVVGLGAQSKYESLKDSCGRTDAGCTDSQINSVSSRATTANIFYGLAAAGAVASGIGFFTSEGGGGVRLASRF